MKNPATTPVTTLQLPTGAWSVALRDQLAKEAIAQMPPDAPEEHKLAVMEQLVKKLQALRDYDLFDPRQLESVVPKRNYREVENVNAGSYVHALQALPDGSIVSAPWGSGARIWNKGSDGQWICELVSDHMGYSLCCQHLPDGRIVSGYVDNTIRIWTKGADGEWSHEVLSGHTDGVGCLQALPDGRIVSGSYDKTIRVWTKGAGGQWSSEVLGGHTNWVQSLQCLPDGRIVSGSWDDTIRIWTKDAAGEWSSEVLRGHTDFVGCLQYLPDGRIVSGSGDHTIRIWTKGAAGQWRSEALSGHTSGVKCLQCLPDGRIVSGSHDKTIRIWTQLKDSPIQTFVRDWMPILSVRKWESEILSGHSCKVTCLQVLPDGRIFSGSDDFTIRIWDGDEIVGGQS